MFYNTNETQISETFNNESLNSLPTHQFNNNLMVMSLDEDLVRLVVLGEASMLSTAILRSSQRSSTTLRTNSSAMQSRISTLVAEYEEDDDDEAIADPLLKSLIRLKGKLRKDKLVVTDPNYLRPFCEIIKNKDVSGPVTGLALESILKFIHYGLINNENTVQMISDSVTKARFIGTDTSSDEVVLMRILNVLRELIVRRYESLTNEAVCEIMQSCFRIAFEPRLSELLRKSAEQALVDMVQVLFRRIPEFDESVDSCFVKMGPKINSSLMRKSKHTNKGEFTNKQSIKFNKDSTHSAAAYYGLACINELLSYLTSLINPLPDGQNTEAMINVGLTLLTVAFETSVMGIGSKQCLISTVRTDLCWNIMQLLQSDRPLSSFAASLRLAFLIFTNLRMHLKYQFEALIIRLMDIITTGNVPFEFREITLEYLVAFFRHLHHLPHEIYFNYDCDPYASNLLEDLLQLFSKNCFTTSVNNQQIAASSGANFTFTSMQLLSFDALLANLKSLQKAELCHNNTLVVCPATTVIPNVLKKLPIKAQELTETIEKTTDIEVVQSAPTVSDIELSHTIQPQDIDVGVIGGDQIESFSEIIYPTTDCQQKVQIIDNLPEENDTAIKEIQKLDSASYKTLVEYKFPKLERVPQNTHDITHQKQRKVMLWTATEQFNAKPAKGIQFLHENKLVDNEMDIVSFLRDNPKLDKKQIGDYISNKKNLKVLQAFAESFAFKDIRIDEALRNYLESFRLPGEAPLISLVLEHFAHHWHESNGCPFENEDAAFSLAYAIIMLNVDQHNTNVKRQSNPMTCEEFISNLRQVNGGKDFDSEMLREIYFVIKTNEIIMPAEQQGLIRERYLWKCLLRKSETENGVYWYLKNFAENDMIQTKDNNIKETNEHKQYDVKLLSLNGSIFAVLWGPTVAAMTFIFDKINPEQQSGLTRRILNNGFNSCALLCATYGHLDNLIVNLSKFIMNSSYAMSPSMSRKSELAAQCLFGITREYSNEMRESWTNIIELILNWYNAKLLNDTFEIEDFALESKKLRFKRKDIRQNLKPANDTSSTYFSSWIKYFAGNQQENDEQEFIETKESNDAPTQEENAIKVESNAQTRPVVNNYCQPLLLIIEESKFLHIDSLLELIKALINVQLDSEEFDDDIEVFKLEIIIQIILMNRDRVTLFWPQISQYIIKLFPLCANSDYLTERVISAIFRLAIRFTPRPDSLSEHIFSLLHRMLLSFEASKIQRKTTAIALHSFVTHCNCFVTRSEDWSLIFDLLLYIGIGFQRNLSKNTALTDSDGYINVQSENEDNCDNSVNVMRGYTSDSDITVTKTVECSHNSLTFFTGNNSSTTALNSSSVYRILDLDAYEKCTEILTLIIREILPNNVKNHQTNSNYYPVAQLAVEAVLKFVEASVKIQVSFGKTGHLRRSMSQKYIHRERVRSKARSAAASNKSRLSRIANAILSSSESEDDDNEDDKKHKSFHPKLSSVTETCSLKLLDLMHYFHLNAALTVQNNASDYLWTALWCPLLQGIALFCCDSRRPVRTCALTFLQRALLLHDLRILSASQWENCFNKVLFPLLSKLLEPLNMCDPIGMDETRMRATNLLCKVFLQHLTPLLTLPTFTALWLTILDFMDKYIKADMQTDLVKEAIPESLKNILLVMDTAGCFNDALAAITWDRIAIFLPTLRQEIMLPQIITYTEEQPETIRDVPNTNVTNTDEINKEMIQDESTNSNICPTSETNNIECQTTSPPTPTYYLPQTISANNNGVNTPSYLPSTHVALDMENNCRAPQTYAPVVGFPGMVTPLPNMVQTDITATATTYVNTSFQFPQSTQSTHTTQYSAYPWPQPSNHNRYN